MCVRARAHHSVSVNSAWCVLEEENRFIWSLELRRLLECRMRVVTRKNRFHLWNTRCFQCGRDKEHTFQVCIYVKRSTVFAYLSPFSSACGLWFRRTHTLTCTGARYIWLVCCMPSFAPSSIHDGRLAASTAPPASSSSPSRRKPATRTIHDIIYFNSIFIHKTNCTVGSCFSSSQHVISIRCGFFYCSHILPNIW